MVLIEMMAQYSAAKPTIAASDRASLNAVLCIKHSAGHL
jgi:hypothetical protein